METSKVLPIFMCCARDDELLECTFNSYCEYVHDSFATPIIFFNASDDEVENRRFRKKVKETFGSKPFIFVENRMEHTYQNVQKASFDCLAYAQRFARRKGAWWNWLLLRKPIKYDGVMFCEDDVTFSNLMVNKVRDFPLTKDMGFVTVYQPENGYRLHTGGKIDFSVFYGTQCLIFPLDNLQHICYNDKDNEGYDRVWVKKLAGLGKPPYALDASYVQHNQVSSLLSGHGRTHSSGVFRFDLEAL